MNILFLKVTLKLIFIQIKLLNKEPIEIKKDDILKMNFERINNGKKVWYQWNFLKFSNDAKDIKVFPIQNLFGESYTMNL